MNEISRCLVIKFDLGIGSWPGVHGMECQDDVYRNGHFQFSNGLARLDYGVASGGRMRPNLVQRMDCNAGKK